MDSIQDAKQNASQLGGGNDNRGYPSNRGSRQTTDLEMSMVEPQGKRLYPDHPEVGQRTGAMPQGGPNVNYGFAPDPRQVGRQGMIVSYPPNQGVQPAGYFMAPPNTQIVTADDRTGKPKAKNMGDGENPKFIIFKRVISILLVIGNIIVDWLQFAEMKGTLILDSNANSIFDFLYPDKYVSADCDLTRPGMATAIYTIFTILGTLFCLVRIANIIGETLYQVTKGKKGWGWQFFHGFSETVLSYIIEDLPQGILLILFNTACTCSTSEGKQARVIIACVMGSITNIVRWSTCRREYEPCCDCSKVECCKDTKCCDCCSCPDKIDFPYCCCYIPLEGDNCCKPTCYYSCDGGCCDGNCLKPVDEDPKCAKDLGEYLEILHIFTVIANIVFTFCLWTP